MVKGVLHPPFDQYQQYKGVEEIVKLIKDQCLYSLHLLAFIVES